MATWNQARLFGVLGDPVDHSLSPAMHNAAFAAARLPHVYLRYRVPATRLPAAVREAKALRMGGLNLTVPLKEAILPLLDTPPREGPAHPYSDEQAIWRKLPKLKPSDLFGS